MRKFYKYNNLCFRSKQIIICWNTLFRFWLQCKRIVLKTSFSWAINIDKISRYISKTYDTEGIRSINESKQQHLASTRISFFGPKVSHFSIHCVRWAVLCCALLCGWCNAKSTMVYIMNYILHIYKPVYMYTYTFKYIQHMQSMEKV